MTGFLKYFPANTMVRITDNDVKTYLVEASTYVGTDNKERIQGILVKKDGSPIPAYGSNNGYRKLTTFTESKTINIIWK